MGHERKKIGLALGSGGARGFCHLGVLRAFEENNIPIDYVTGCSMGAMVGGCYCAGVPLDTLCEIAESITQFVVMDINLSLKKYGLLKGQRAINKIKPLIGNKTFEDCVIPFKATAVEIRKGELKVLDSGMLIDAIRASISIPVAFHAIEHDKEILVDGGVMERIPINACREMGADIVIAVDALGEPQPDCVPEGIIGMIERSFALIDWESAKHKIKEADFLITPEQGCRSIFSFKDNHFSVQKGYEMAQFMMPEILKIIK